MTPEMAAADRWLAALRDRDSAALVAGTQYPFEWLDSRESYCAAKQPAANEPELTLVLDCLFADEAFLRLLAQHERAGIQQVPSSRLQAWAQLWQSRVPAGATLVNAFMQRSEGRADIDVWLIGGAVRALWTHVEDGSAAVLVAEQWLGALQRRDLPALIAATRFPFEVRDTGRSSFCGRRVAGKPEQLEKAVECVLDDRDLLDGLSAKQPIVEAASEGDSVPSWAETWRLPEQRATLHQTFTTVVTPNGVSLDLILMTTPGGVRAVWKRGSREARD